MANSTKISEYSTTAASNTSIDSIDIDENCAASGINNAIRSVLKHQADAFTQGTPIALDQTNNRVGIGTTSPSTILHVEDGDVTIGNSTTTGDNKLVFKNASATLAEIRAADTSTGTGALLFTNNGSERLRIDSSGNVGIGTSSISRKLDVAGAMSTDSIVFRSNNSAPSGDAGIYRAADNTIALSTGSTERMRIDSSGNVKISDKFEFTSGGDFEIPAAGFSQAYDSKQIAKAIIYSARGNTSSSAHIVFKNPNGEVGTITTQSSSTSYNTSSDHRLKENVADMTGAITRVKALAPKRFNFIADDSVTVDGFLAHEAQAVVPESVTGTHNEVETWTQQEIDDGNAPDGTSAGDNKLDGDGNTIPVMQGIDQSKLVPLLTAALKESIAKIETLETEMTALKARVTALEA